MRDEKLRAVVARSTFGSQNAKNTSCSSTFGSSDVEKVRAVAAQNAFPSQNVHHTSFGGLLEVEMRKTCTPLFSKPKV